jgi:hypothetical protein
MGWMEMRSILVKLRFAFDKELVDQELDWHRDSEVHTLWKKPDLKVRLTKRQKNVA